MMVCLRAKAQDVIVRSPVFLIRFHVYSIYSLGIKYLALLMKPEKWLL